MDRLVLFSFLLCTAHISLQGQEVLQQKVSLGFETSTLKEVLDDITRQTGMRFAFNKQDIDLNQVASLRAAGQVTVEDALMELLSSSGVEFAVTGRHISLFRRKMPSYTISGYIRDEASGEALIGANVYDEQKLAGTSTNEYGFFSLSLPKGRRLIRTSFVGFEERTDTVILQENLYLDWELSAGNTLSEIVVTGESANTGEEGPERSFSPATKINPGNAGAFSSILGEQDVLKVVQLRPGVLFGSEGSSGFHVRGGSADQNLILLDGVPLYNVTHLFGLVSIFNAKAINSTTFYQSGFPARFSGRLSSVLDVRMKDGNNQELHGGIKLGIISGTAYLEGPIKKGKSSFLLSGRRTWLDLIAASAQIGNKEVKTNYNFYDLNAKASFQISDRDRLLFSFYGGNDRFFDRRTPSAGLFDDVSQGFNSDNRLKWGNKAIALRWNRVLSPKVFSNTTLFFGNFNYRAEEYLAQDVTVTDIEAATKIRDYGLKLDLDWQPNYLHRLRFGSSYTLHDFTPGFFTGWFSIDGRVSEIREGAPRVSAHEVGVYLEDEITLSEKWDLNSGIHLSLIHTDHKWFARPQLRTRLRHSPSAQSSWEFSYSGMTQFVHLLANNSIGILPTDLWVPSTSSIPPGTAHQLATSYRANLKKKWRLKTGAYYKWMNNLVEYQSGATLINSTANWESRIESGRGWSYGSFLLVEKTGRKTLARLAYTISWSKRQFEGINKNQPFPYVFDRRHNLNLNLKHSWRGRKDKDKDIALVWVLASGHLIDLPSAKFRDLNGAVVDLYDSRNNYRLPLYHRLDLSKSNTKKTKAGHARTWRWGIYNLYGQANIFTATPVEGESGESKFINGQSIFPMPIPYLHYELDF